MPELPEVETIRRTLAPEVEGKAIDEVLFHWERTCIGNAEETAARLAGQRIEQLERYGKYLMFRLTKDGRDSLLSIHLRMTGNLLLDSEPGPYTRAEMILRGGPSLVFHDIRKFGRWQWSRELPARLAALGPEPLEVTLEEFKGRLAPRKGRLKPLLLNQEFLRGLGNIYADEALFRARLHPLRSAADVGPRKVRDLYAAIRSVLLDAIAAGGTSINNYMDGRGAQGYFQLQVQVYGKTGNPCSRCRTAIRRIVVSQRSTHYCPRCQRR